MRNHRFGHLAVIVGLLLLPACNGDNGPSPTLVARPGGPYGPVNTYTPITFNGLTSTSSPNAIAHYFWHCGQADLANCQQDTPTPVYTYTKTQQNVSGKTLTYDITLVVEDTEGNRSQPATTTVMVTQIYEPGLTSPNRKR